MIFHSNQSMKSGKYDAMILAPMSRVKSLNKKILGMTGDYEGWRMGRGWHDGMMA